MMEIDHDALARFMAKADEQIDQSVVAELARLGYPASLAPGIVGGIAALALARAIARGFVPNKALEDLAHAAIELEIKGKASR